MAKLYPELSPHELEQAEVNVTRYLSAVLQIWKQATNGHPLTHENTTHTLPVERSTHIKNNNPNDP